MNQSQTISLCIFWPLVALAHRAYACCAMWAFVVWQLAGKILTMPQHAYTPTNIYFFFWWKIFTIVLPLFSVGYVPVFSVVATIVFNYFRNCCTLSLPFALFLSHECHLFRLCLFLPTEYMSLVVKWNIFWIYEFIFGFCLIEFIFLFCLKLVSFVGFLAIYLILFILYLDWHLI